MKQSPDSIGWLARFDAVTRLLAVLKDPTSVRGLDAASWDILVRQARHANLLGRLYKLLEKSGELEGVPERPRNHLLSGSRMADRQHLSIKYETSLLRETLNARGIPVILLKGAAYVLASLPSASGRVFADIDILVPHAQLNDAESALMLAGWVSTSQDAYDQRYYRQWMHELPAMEHMFRGTTLDVHHTILPPTSRLKPDPVLLVKDSSEIPDMPGVYTLSPCDMVLHSAAHLFHEGEPDNLLRDLSDLDILLRHFGVKTGFWNELAIRAKRLQLEEPLRLAVRYTRHFLDTPFADDVLKTLRVETNGNLRQRFLDTIYLRVFRPQHQTCYDRFSSLARKLLYVRSHWLRMPPHLLAYHLAHKALFPPKVESVPLTDDVQAL